MAAETISRLHGETKWDDIKFRQAIAERDSRIATLEDERDDDEVFDGSFVDWFFEIAIMPLLAVALGLLLAAIALGSAVALYHLAIHIISLW